MTVTISGTFKQDSREYNGLEAIEDDLIKDPLTNRYALVRLSTLRITEEIADGGVRTPTVRLMHIEPLQGDEAERVKERMAELMRARTGTLPQDPLPLGDDDATTERPKDEWLDDKVTDTGGATTSTGKARRGRTRG